VESSVEGQQQNTVLRITKRYSHFYHTRAGERLWNDPIASTSTSGSSVVRAATAADPRWPVKRSTATVSSGTVTRPTSSSLGSGSVSMVQPAGMKNRTTDPPSALEVFDTGAVMAIFWLDCRATGAVIGIFALPWLPPKM